ncbi:MAG: RNA polymerase sigma factor [Actinomycetota bacterium]
MHDNSRDLITAASRGDRRAAGEYFSQNLRLLTAVSRRIAGNAVDPDDLLSEAMLGVLTKWSQGSGPTEFVNAYIAQSMRNRLKDELKSPRSKVTPIEDSDDLAAERQPGLRRADLHRELSLVRHALATLPADQQAVLTATVVEGKKPRDIESELGRPSSAIYSLSRRARLNLRRAVLKLMLDENAPDACREAARQLPDAVGKTPDETVASDPSSHYRTCSRCRRVWSGFASFSAGLSIAALAIVSDLLGPTASVQADDHGEQSQRADSAESVSPRRAPSSEQTAGATTQSAAPSAAAPLPLSDPTTAASVSAAPLPPGDPVAGGAGSSPASSASDGSPAATPRTSSMRTGGRGLVARVGGAAALAVGLGALGLVGYAFTTQQLWFVPEPTAQFDVSRAAETGESSVFLVDFEVHESQWSVNALTMQFDTGVGEVRAPAGWNCEIGGDSAVCTTDEPDPRGGEFTVTPRDSAPLGGYRFTVTAVTPAGAEIVGTVERAAGT